MKKAYLVLLIFVGFCANVEGMQTRPFNDGRILANIETRNIGQDKRDRLRVQNISVHDVIVNLSFRSERVWPDGFRRSHVAYSEITLRPREIWHGEGFVPRYGSGFVSSFAIFNVSVRATLQRGTRPPPALPGGTSGGFTLRLGGVSVSAPRPPAHDMEIAISSNRFSRFPSNWFTRVHSEFNITESEIRTELYRIGLTTAEQNSIFLELIRSEAVIFYYLNRDNFYRFVHIEFN